MASIKDRLYKQATKDRVPLTGAFELSPLCNFNCKMCYVRRNADEAEREGGVRPLEFWLDAARQAKEAGTIFPLLTGGEWGLSAKASGRQGNCMRRCVKWGCRSASIQTQAASQKKS